MQKILTVCSLLLVGSGVICGQDKGFNFGKVTLREIDMKSYVMDTTAAAVVLQEFGEAYIDPEGFEVRFEHHVKIKILKQAGIDEGDIQLLLHRENGKEEIVTSFEASSFNMEGGRIVESKMQTKDMFRQEASDYTIVHRYAIPNVKAGSVIEYQYSMKSPWNHTFHSWEFQSDIPKVTSEYWATYPPYFTYNITLRGFLPLTTNKSEVIRSSFSTSWGTSDVTRMKFGMDDIPAFKVEKYMTARSNYLAAVNFELLDFRYPDGRIDKITTEWKDAAEELRRENRFGVQLKRAKNILGDEIAVVIAGVTDPLEKAKRVYDFVKHHFEWNGVYGKYSEHGIRKAMDLKEGNIGDINLTMVAALLAADLNAEPVILSTRENGFPVELHPVISDYNYVIARLMIDNKVYLLDGTDDFLPFGLIPERCINGKGRVIGEKDSGWQTLDAPGNRKWVALLNMKILPDGKMTGHAEINYYHYDAVDERKKITRINDDNVYIAKNKGEALLGTSNIQKENVDQLDKPLTIKYDFDGEVFDATTAAQFFLNPFMVNSWKENPFKSNERLYPVDFGIPIDQRAIVTIEFPEGYLVKSIPENVGLALPNAGGRYLYQSKAEGNKVSISSNLVVSKTFYTAQEYHYLKELFARVLQTQNTDMVVGKN